MVRAMKKTNIICVKVDDDMLEEVVKIANEFKVSKSDIVRMALQKFIKENRRNQTV
jgi:antitoxin component of RelBE/YafQ-DinJ toxin-antitoxin module